MHHAVDPITWTPQRIAVAGVSGAGKTTLCNKLAEILGARRVELDSLFHGPDWVPREAFLDDVKSLIAESLGTRTAVSRPSAHRRGRHPRVAGLSGENPDDRAGSPHLRRRVTREELWNGNIEPPLRTVFTDPDHIVRFAWRTRNKLKPVIPTLEGRFPGLHVVRLTHPEQVSPWTRALRARLDARPAV